MKNFVTITGIGGDGKQAPKKFIGSGGMLDLKVEPEMIYYISGYTKVCVETPNKENCFAHLFIDFPNTAAGIEITTDFPIYGNDPSTARAGDSWEISIDGYGGIVCLKKQVI